MNKYNAVKVKDDGYVFDSKGEHRRYCELKLLQKSKKIKDLEVHPVFSLRVDDSPICKYKADFEYMEDGKWIIEDYKSEATMTQGSIIKMKLFSALFPSAKLRISGIKNKPRWLPVEREESNG